MGYVGKNHVPVGNEGYGTGLMDESFDYWYAGHTHLRFYLKERPSGYFHVAGDENMFDNASADTQTEILGEGVDNFLSPNEEFYSKASRFLEKRPADKPFCLSLCFNLPHDAGTETMKLRPTDPELYRTAYRDKFEQIISDLPKTYTAAKDIKKPKIPSDVLIAQNRQTGYDYVNTPQELAERIIRRYQTITGIDNLVGRLREKLSQLHLADNTVIFFCSDHGIMRGEFGLGGKALCYEPCIRVPMIVYDPRAPKSAKGQRRGELVQSIDIAPTIMDLAGLKITGDMQGDSMLGLIYGKNIKWRQYAFSENLWSTYFGNPRIECARGREWKYLRYFFNDRSLYEDGLTTSARYRVSQLHAEKYLEWLSSSINGEKPVYEELFYLPDDPDEINNLADNPRHAEILRKMRGICDDLVKKAKGNQPPSVVELKNERLEVFLQTLKHD
jgi:arylsulfatase A-like enzyme